MILKKLKPLQLSFCIFFWNGSRHFSPRFFAVFRYRFPLCPFSQIYSLPEVLIFPPQKLHTEFVLYWCISRIIIPACQALYFRFLRIAMLKWIGEKFPADVIMIFL